MVQIAVMKNFIIYIFALSFIFFSCSNDEAPELNEIPEAQECEATHSLVGESRALVVSEAYGISGTVTIVSDCEVQFSNFFYNGLGPAVSIYAGLDGDFVSGISLSEPIDGRQFSGETFSVFLPEGSSFDEFNSFSVWCFQFDIDFSSVSF